MNDRHYNFSAGPANLPLRVLEQAQRELLCLPGAGASVMEISHRGAPFRAILDEAEANYRRLLEIPDNYRVLFLQGGARLQFSMVPMNLLRLAGKSADYILTGAWGNKAIEEARNVGDVRIAWDGRETAYDRLPEAGQLDLNADAAYAHFTSNETIQGVQFLDEPAVGDVPLVCDASSDLLCRPLPIEKYALIYASAQKNCGPAGVTVVIVRDDVLQRSDKKLPGYLSYANHAAEGSLYNTAPTFAIYLVNLVAKWLLDEIGGLAAMETQNRRKAKMLYDVLDESGGFYQGHARAQDRSLMNVTFRLPDEDLDQQFLAEAESQQLDALKGHRSVGGVRASIYNAMPVEGVEKLAEFMKQFQQKAGK
ncbi:MAG: 3-phosphoserine/phosphohydroxythreonine transaminase [Planctomycetes bacterium]|nr:3-phosphoserine/phosphohydroxythreonine transaminase [Planctomycetota bacterium]